MMVQLPLLILSLMVAGVTSYDCYNQKCKHNNGSTTKCDNKDHQCELAQDGAAVCVEGQGSGEGIYCKGTHSCDYNATTGVPVCNYHYISIAAGVAIIIAMVAAVGAASWSYMSQPHRYLGVQFGGHAEQKQAPNVPRTSTISVQGRVNTGCTSSPEVDNAEADTWNKDSDMKMDDTLRDSSV